MKNVDVYWSFRSPYSYLATPGMRKLRDDYQVAVNLRVVLPIAVRSPELLFNPQNANRTKYILLDWVRRAQFLDMPHAWPSPDHLAQATARAGLDLQAMERAIEGDGHLAEIEENHKQLDAAGQWGVPTFVFEGEPFFGQDRIDTLYWRLDQHGLHR